MVHAGGLNEYIWQAWAYLESNQNNVGQARKVRAGFLAVRGGIIPRLLFPHSHCIHNHELSIPTWLTMPLSALDSFSLAGFFTSTLSILNCRYIAAVNSTEQSHSMVTTWISTCGKH